MRQPCGPDAGALADRGATRSRFVSRSVEARGACSGSCCVDGILLSTVAFAGALPLAWGIIRVVTASLVSPPRTCEVSDGDA